MQLRGLCFAWTCFLLAKRNREMKNKLFTNNKNNRERQAKKTNDIKNGLVRRSTKDMCKMKNPPAFAIEMAIWTLNADAIHSYTFHLKWLIKLWLTTECEIVHFERIGQKLSVNFFQINLEYAVMISYDIISIIWNRISINEWIDIQCIIWVSLTGFWLFIYVYKEHILYLLLSWRI